MGYDQTKEKGGEIKSFDKLGQIDPVDLRFLASSHYFGDKIAICEAIS
jgi:hypothetical protein